MEDEKDDETEDILEFGADIYAEKYEEKDGYFKVRIIQLILCVALVAALFFGFSTKSNVLKSGYEYLTEHSWTDGGFSEVKDALMNFINGKDNVEL